VPEPAGQWRRKEAFMTKFKSAWRNVAAVLLGLGPMYIFVIGSHILRGGAYTLKEMLLYPLIMGSAMIFWIAFLYKALAGKDWRRIDRKPGTWAKDAISGVGLGLGLLLLLLIQRSTIYRWLPGPPANRTMLTLIQGLVRDPLLLAIWLGPVVWIGVAVFEEFQRAFMLDLLTDVAPKTGHKAVVLFLSAGLFGLAHLYQGPAGVAGTFLFAVVMGLYYLVRGRIGPMIIGHALYDSVQIIMLVIQIRRGGG
jgi:membrane protease YdiL (CAAX protease family)